MREARWGATGDCLAPLGDRSNLCVVERELLPESLDVIGRTREVAERGAKTTEIFGSRIGVITNTCGCAT
jgi:hypothetical protein